MERKKKIKEIRKVMKEEEKLRQRDRETAATVSCSPTQPLPVVPPVKEETHSPEVSPPPQKRLERPEPPLHQTLFFGFRTRLFSFQ